MTARLQRWHVTVQGKRGARHRYERSPRPLTWHQAARFVDTASDRLEQDGWRRIGVHLNPEQGE